MTTFATAQEAIKHSIDYDTIAFCENTEENRDFLAMECDDSAEGNDELEYWADAEDSNGTDGNMEWRVHIVID
jgi:hypothetical protein